MAATGEEILGMSDEDFLKMPVPVVEAPSEPQATSGADTPVVTEPVVPVPAADAPAVTEGEGGQEENGSTDAPVTPAPVAEPAPVTEGQVADGQTPKTEGEKKDPADKVEGEKQPETEPDYKALYEQLMSPLKANGKTIDLRNPEELIQLAQQGANYTRKMQELAPKRKLLLMLENNGLDENQLSFFVDLKNKNPEAIKKLLKDSGIDPMDLDTSTEPAYQQGNHRVTDAEANFQSVLDDVRSTDEGKQTLQAIHSTWDQASKEHLWENPDVMQIMHEQRQSGVYNLIEAEVNRQRTLGKIPANIPFLQAYKAVGEQMVAENKFQHLVEKEAAPVQTPAVPVASRTAAPKAAVVNNDKARAASPTQTTTNSAQVKVNPLAMSDEDFLKLASTVRL